LGHSFRGQSDTEVLLNAIQAWGIEKTLPKLNGMFAFGLWDEEKQKLFLSRDRLGEKPLYYGYIGNQFVFGSELKPFMVFAKERGEKLIISLKALGLYFRHQYVPSPYSIFEGVSKLPPGSFAVVGVKKESPSVRTYWSLEDISALPKINSYEEATRQLEELLIDSVKKRMLSEVPLGAFLSGGVDSSIIVALMQKSSSEKVKTFSIGFHEDEFNEANEAKRFAEFLNTDHHEMILGKKECLEIIPKMGQIYDEPLADSSQIPTWLVSQFAKKSVTVALSGDGGDEIFGGYDRYRSLLWVSQWKQKVPAVFLVPLLELVRKLGRNPRFSGRIEMLKRTAKQADQELYSEVMTYWNCPEDLLVDGWSYANSPLEKSWGRKKEMSLLRKMLFVDQKHFLPDNILAKLDRASMNVALETRVPFLDHRIVEFSTRLSDEFLVSAFKSKRILKNLFVKHFPASFLQKKKRGFSIPLGQWLSTDLKEWAESILSPTALASSGLIDPQVAKDKWKTFIAGEPRAEYQVWPLIIFQLWYQNFQETLCRPSSFSESPRVELRGESEKGRVF
jgi:asparagine synthase (glutamine-hydrolysing)